MAVHVIYFHFVIRPGSPQPSRQEPGDKAGEVASYAQLQCTVCSSYGTHYRGYTGGGLPVTTGFAKVA